MKIKTAMIIDDSEPDQFLTSKALTEFDPSIHILQAYDGQEALDMLEESADQPEVIFLDINMPVMDGHEFLEEYSKRDGQASIVIMLTSSDQTHDHERSRAYLCVKKYLAKPLGPECLGKLKDL